MSAPPVGQLLVASRQLLDPNFVRTVVLIVQQDEGGIVGLILNRPLELTVAEACDPAAEEIADVDEKLSHGGPCPGPLMVLHSHQLVGGETVIDGVRFTSEREDIRSLMDDSGGGGGSVRYFAGYSGWSPEQLENEIGQGAWLLAPASRDEVFGDTSPDSLWAKLTTRLTVGKWIDVERMPEDPSVN
jgi:putative transcriptional regulator